MTVTAMCNKPPLALTGGTTIPVAEIATDLAACLDSPNPGTDANPLSTRSLTRQR